MGVCEGGWGEGVGEERDCMRGRIRIGEEVMRRVLGMEGGREKGKGD